MSATPFRRYFDHLHEVQGRCGAIGSTIEQGLPTHKGKKQVSISASLEIFSILCLITIS